MKCRVRSVPGILVILVILSSASSALAFEEPDRLWLVGEHAFADGLYPLAARVLERFVDGYADDKRLPDAVLLLGKARLELGDAEAALEAFRRAQTFSPPPGQPAEAKFWEAEALFRLRRFTEARAAYERVVRADPPSPRAPDALYGLAWSELRLKRPEPAVTAFRDFLKQFPGHPLAPSATFYLARSLVDLKRYKDAIPVLVDFSQKYGDNKLAVEAAYLLGVARINGGEARQGIADLRAFVAAHPKDELAPQARRQITEGMVRQGGKGELQDAYKSLMAQTPPTPEALADAANIAGRLGRPRDQEAAWRKLRTRFPDHPLARRAALDQGTAAFKRKEWKDAAALGRSAAASDDPGVRGEGWLLVGESELKQKHLPAALKAFTAASEVQGVDAAVRYRALAGAGLVHEEQREWKAALAAYESVASGSPDGTLRDWARARVAAVKARTNGTAPSTRPKTKGPS